MRARIFICAFCVSTALYLGADTVYPQGPETVKLPAPRQEGGKPLMQALKERKTERAFSPRELTEQVLSDLLWAACGVNRPGSGGRTAPSAMNMQEIDVYVATKDGVYLYNGAANELVRVVAEDIRALTGGQPFVKDAPANLIFVADRAKMGRMSPENVSFYAAADTGFISQNVYLYCASEGLATVVRGWVDRPPLKAAMKLRADQDIVLTQTVGYPGE